MPTPPSNLPFEPASATPPPAPVATAPVPPPRPVAPPPAPTVPPLEGGEGGGVKVPSSPSPAIRTMPRPIAQAGKSEPEDIFAKTDTASKTSPQDGTAVAVSPPSGRGPVVKYLLIALAALFILVVIGYAVWRFLIRKPEADGVSFASQPSVPAQQAETAPPAAPSSETPPLTAADLGIGVATDSATELPALPPANTDNATIVIPPPVNVPPAGTNVPLPTIGSVGTSTAPSATMLDTDQDGLTDQREGELGTNPMKNDSDADGLMDGDEVLKYGTNPLNVDTDGDSYADGVEVQNGYSPRGAGKCSNATCIL